MNIISFFKNIISLPINSETTAIIIIIACVCMGAHARTCASAREVRRLHGELDDARTALADTQEEIRAIRADVTARVAELDAIRARMHADDEIDAQRRSEDDTIDTIMADDDETSSWMCGRLPDALTEWLRELPTMP